MPYVESMTGWLRRVERVGVCLKDIRVLILMWTDRSLSCCEPKDHGELENSMEKFVTLITDFKKCQYFQRQQQEYKKGFQVKAKKYS